MTETSEEQRLQGLLSFERRLWKQGAVHVAGVDEAGRGPLAGPVVAAAVILPRKRPEVFRDRPLKLFLWGLNDSKKLSPAKRESLFEAINRAAAAVGIGIIGEREIDRINILRASFKAMRQAIKALGVTPDHILVDGAEIPHQEIPQTGIVKGDALSLSIAAASVIAKVTRDKIMVRYDAEFPAYGFARHKGYGTPQHVEALRKYGPCRIHRRSFRKVKDLEFQDDASTSLRSSEDLG